MSDNDDYNNDDDGGAFEEEVCDEEMYIEFDSTPVSRQNSFKTMEIPVKKVRLTNFKELDAYVSDISDSFGSFLALDKDQSESLLVSYKWNKEKALDDFIANPEKMISVAGLSNYDATVILDRIRQKSPTGQEMTCLICFDTKDTAECFALGCNHWFCKECYLNSLEATIELTGCNTRCLANGMLCGSQKVQCNERVVPSIYRELPRALDPSITSSSSTSLFEMVTSADTIAAGGGSDEVASNGGGRLSTKKTCIDRYRMKVVRNLIENNPSNMSYCPGVDCEMVAVGSEVSKVQCNCGTRYCFKCKEPDHEPCSCDNYKSWKVRADEEGLNVLWINENTQRCPKTGCNHPIEKNGGCDWIRCKCRHEFCWICDSEWFNHTTVRHPDCPGPKVRVNGVAKGSSSGLSAQHDSNLFSYCFTRYKLHQNCEKHAIEGLSKFMAQCETSVEGDTLMIYFTHMEREDIKSAWKLIAKCRGVLTYAYAFIYYQSKEALDRKDREAAAAALVVTREAQEAVKTAKPPFLHNVAATSSSESPLNFISNALLDEQLKMLEKQTEILQGFIEKKINNNDAAETRQYMRDIYNHNDVLNRYMQALVSSVQVDVDA